MRHPTIPARTSHGGCRAPSLRRLLFAAAVLAILVVAAALRLPRLAQRPMHADEANQAVKSWRLYAQGENPYDTADHHGPTLYWLTLPSLALSGAKDLAGTREVDYRIVTVLFGLGLIPLVLLLTDGLGGAQRRRRGLAGGHFAGAGVLQPLLHPGNAAVVFTLAALGCGWRYVRTRRLIWIVAAGASVGMMHATKETWILSAAAALAAAGLTWCWSRLRDTERGAGSGERGVRFRTPCSLLPCSQLPPPRRSPDGLPCRRCLLLDVRQALGRPSGIDPGLCQLFPSRQPTGRALRTVVLLSSGLLRRLAFETNFLERGLDRPAGAGGGIDALGQRKAAEAKALPRFLTFYTFLLTLLYSLISYKTPWCGLNFLIGMILLAESARRPSSAAYEPEVQVRERLHTLAVASGWSSPRLRSCCLPARGTLAGSPIN